MAIWLYAASRAKASAPDTLWLACNSGFVWRPFYNRTGIPVACVKQIQAGDTLLLGYRERGYVGLLARFRIGRPDQSIGSSPVFGVIPAAWKDEFQRRGYTADPKLGEIVGIFVEQCEPFSGELPYSNQNALSKLESERHLPTLSASSEHANQRFANVRVEDSVTQRSGYPPSPPKRSEHSSAVRDGVHIGIDVGGRSEKGFDLCITEWISGVLDSVQWKRLPHTRPLPPTSSLRLLVRDRDVAALAGATKESAFAISATLWREIERFSPAGIYIDSPSAFSRNLLGHGRRCEKRSLTGVSFQSTPSVACRSEHGGDWGWLVYGMIAFSACLHRGRLSAEDWLTDLSMGTYAHFDSTHTVLRECFPSATISMLRERERAPDVELLLAKTASQAEVDAVIKYLKHGVIEVKRRAQSIYDRADALVAALGALPHASHAFQESAHCGMHGKNWTGKPGDEQIEGTFVCVE
jgi:hypothetical protein